MSKLTIPLTSIFKEVEFRSAAIKEQKPDWPCCKGCDLCCRSLAEAPSLSLQEWRAVEEGLSSLAGDVRRGVEDRLEQVAQQTEGKVTCPFLDLESGACRIYLHRPVACRTYGYYRDRSGGLFCTIIEEKIETEGEETLVWGNHDALQARLEKHAGAPIPLKDWWLRR